MGLNLYRGFDSHRLRQRITKAPVLQGLFIWLSDSGVTNRDTSFSERSYENPQQDQPIPPRHLLFPPSIYPKRVAERVLNFPPGANDEAADPKAAPDPSALPDILKPTPQAPKMGGATIPELIERFATRQRDKLAPKTLYEYRNYQKIFKNWVAKRKQTEHYPIREINRQDVSDFIDDLLAEGITHNTVQQKYWRDISALFELAQITGSYPEEVVLPSRGHKLFTKNDAKKTKDKRGCWDMVRFSFSYMGIWFQINVFYLSSDFYFVLLFLAYRNINRKITIHVSEDGVTCGVVRTFGFKDGLLQYLSKRNIAFKDVSRWDIDRQGNKSYIYALVHGKK